VRRPRYRAGVVRDVDEWGITLTVSGEWLAIAEAWGYDALIRLARAAHDEANEHYTRAQKRLDEAFEIADAAREKA
jgi:hypothetical protein